jgi:hypothetical protein
VSPVRAIPLRKSRREIADMRQPGSLGRGV